MRRARGPHSLPLISLLLCLHSVDAYFDAYPERIGNLDPNRKKLTASQRAAAEAVAALSSEGSERSEKDYEDVMQPQSM